MKKVFTVLAIALLVSMLLPFVNAQTSKSYFHSSDYYSVTFDGEGDAVVTAKLVIDNISQYSVKKISLEIPQQAIVYRVVLENYPSHYNGYYPYDVYPERTYSATALDFETERLSSSTIVNLDVNGYIEPEENASIVLIYKVSDYAEKDFLGNFSFDFQTIIDKQAALIQSVRVAVNVQEGFTVKGGQAKVDYRKDYFAPEALGTLQSVSVDSAAYQDFSQNISYVQGAIVKTAVNLDPFESFHVKGSFGENSLLLNLGELIGAVIAIIVVLLLFKFIALPKIKEALGSKSKIPKEGKKKEEKGIKGGSITAKLTASAFSALGIIAYWEIVFAFIPWLLNLIGYREYGLIVILLLFLGIAVSGILLFVPAILSGKKEGFMSGLTVFIATVVFVLVFWIIWLIFKAILFAPIYDIIPLYD